MTVFNLNKVNPDQPMFFGDKQNVARFDHVKYPAFTKATKMMKSLFWNPEEINLEKDAIDFKNLAPHEKHIFTKNIAYQILLDSIQERAPVTALLPWVSLPELEACILWWSAFEQIHAQSYQWILQNVYSDPSSVFDGIIEDESIIKRAAAIIRYYDDFMGAAGDYEYNQSGTTDLYTLKKKLYLAVVAIYALESIRFYVSFACSFAFGQQGKMKGNASIIRLIAKDEAQHVGITVNILRNWAKKESDADFLKIIAESQGEVEKIFDEVMTQEQEWAAYLFKDGSIVGLNETLLTKYLEFIANKRLRAIGLKPRYETTTDPFGWMTGWLGSEDAQVAPQEIEITDYLVNVLDTNVNEENLIDL